LCAKCRCELFLEEFGNAALLHFGLETARLKNTETENIRQLLLPEIFARPGDPLLWPKSDPIPIGLRMMAAYQQNGTRSLEDECRAVAGHKMINGEIRTIYSDGTLSQPNPPPPDPASLPPIREWHQVGLDAQREQAADSARMAKFYEEQERGREAKNAEAAAGAQKYADEQRRLQWGAA
jgi:hypothetical protein